METAIHKSSARGYARHSWLETYYSFSFADYHDSSRMHFGMLRVLNDDVIAPAMGFGTHPHDNMEIITLVLKGALKHQDSMGTSAVIAPGEVQIMSAGTGVKHSEFNPSGTEETSLLQMWIFPRKKNIAPRYEQKLFLPEEKKNKLKTIVSPDGENGSVLINQDAWLHTVILEQGKSAEYNIRIKDNGVYVFVIEGKITINDAALEKRDAMEIRNADHFKIIASEESEILLIEVPMK